MQPFPVEAQQVAGLFHTRCSLQHSNRKRLKHQRKSPMQIGPRHRTRLDSALRTIRSRHSGPHHRLKLHRVHMTPLPLLRMIFKRTLLSALGATKLRPGHRLQPDRHPLNSPKNHHNNRSHGAGGCGTTVNVQTDVWINRTFDPLNNYFICLQ
jgi:hypothetical protein